MRLDKYTSLAKQIRIGLPQGSPLLVILYILYNSELIHVPNLPIQDALLIAYVDDIVHLEAGKSVESVLENLTWMETHSLGWGQRHGAIFDKRKAQLMFLSRAREKLKPISFKLGKTQVKLMESATWLGVMLDQKLTYHQHIGNILKKAQRTIALLGQLGNSRWGLGKQEQKMLLDGVLTPKLTYPMHFWGVKKNLKRLQETTTKIDQMGVRYTKGIFRNMGTGWIELNMSHHPLMEAINKTFCLLLKETYTADM